MNRHPETPFVPGILSRNLPNTDVRVDSDAGTFNGWAVKYGIRDAYGTTFSPGCFSQGTEDLELRDFPYLWFHDPFTPIGTFRAVEKDDGLWIEGRWDDTGEGNSSRARAKSGSAPGLSVGFVPEGVAPDDESVFTSARLVETSQITLGFQAVPGAKLESVRSIDPVPDLRARRARARLTLVGAQKNRSK